MRRALYFALGIAALTLGVLGMFLPLLPTVPFLILAAFAFGRSHPGAEQWLLHHPRFGKAIRSWREDRAISRKGKIGATLAFALSIGLGLAFSPWPWKLAPPLVAVACLPWLWTRPEPSQAGSPPS